MYEFAKEPLGIGRLLDQSIKLTRYTYKSSIPIVALAAVVGVLSVFAGGGTLPVEEGTMPEMSAGQLFAFIVFLILQIYLYFLMMAGITYKAFGKGDLGDAAMMSVKKAPHVLGLYIMFILAVIVGYILLLIPGVILTISLSLSFYCLILEDTGPIASLRRSHELVWGNWWRTMVVISVGVIIVMIFSLTIGFAAGFAAIAFESLDAVFVINLISAGLSPLVQPIFIALALVVYNDVTLRKEGADLSSEIDSL